MYRMAILAMCSSDPNIDSTKCVWLLSSRGSLRLMQTLFRRKMCSYGISARLGRSARSVRVIEAYLADLTIDLLRLKSIIFSGRYCST